MGPVTLYLCTKVEALAALHHIRSRVLQANDIRTVVISQPRGRTLTSESIDEGILTDILVECRRLHRLDLDGWAFDTISAANIQRAAAGALSSIEELVIGPRGTLSSVSFFLLLSAMPALHSVEFNSVIDSTPPTHPPVSDDGPESFAAPACRLKSVVVSDDWGICFSHYAHLLCQSHDTLQHLEAHWVFSEDIGPILGEALAPCRNLRSLVLIGNHFDNSGVISKCPRLRCLTLIEPPTEEELGALCAPLRELRLIHCTPAESDSGIIHDHLPPLQAVLPRLPALDTLRIVSKSVRFDEAYHQVRKLCAERRLHFTTSLPGYDWVM